MNNTNKTTVSDIITKEEILKWKENDTITIGAPCGSGKSYFIKYIIRGIASERNEKILMLLHRTNCVEQFKLELDSIKDVDTSNIVIDTYQSIEANNVKSNGYDLSEYKWLVMDEFHYFTSDIKFNKFCDISLDHILKQTHAIKIFMSATGDEMMHYLNNTRCIDTIKYEIKNPSQPLKYITYFNKDESLVNITEDILSRKEKAIIFIESAQDAYEFFRKFKDVSIFNCSKYNKLYKHVDEYALEEFLMNASFDDDTHLLVTTLCMDSGLDVIDSNVKNIICDTSHSKSTLIQCIGRKRMIDNEDKIHLYVRNLNNCYIGGRETQLKSKENIVINYLSLPLDEFIMKYYRDMAKMSDIIYDDIVDGQLTKKLNYLAFNRILNDLGEIEVIKNEEFGYMGYVNKIFNMESFNMYEKDKHRENLKDHLEMLYITNSELHKEDQTNLINLINMRINGNQIKGYNKLNDGLKMINLPFIIIPKRNSKSRFWIVEKIDE